jgi:hypothetical protein
MTMETLIQILIMVAMFAAIIFGIIFWLKRQGVI